MAASQYAFRAQKTAGVVDGPAWNLTDHVDPSTSGARCMLYSPDGAWLAYASGSSSGSLKPTVHPAHLLRVHVVSTSSTPSSSTPITIEQPNVVALAFSPQSTWIFTFERSVKTEGGGEPYKNVKAFVTSTGEAMGGWYAKGQDDWEPLITRDETTLVRATQSDVLLFQPPLAARPAVRLKLDGTIRGIYLSQPQNLQEGVSSGKPIKANPDPAVAIWLGERKGAPGSVALYPLSTLLGKRAANGAPAANGEEDKVETRNIPMTAARKAFYKADKMTVRWNAAGTMALFLTQSDVDATGKSYYGETNLYLVSVDGQFDGQVELDKEGPIYDFAWSPTSREFSVVYGYMPARVQLFDNKARPLHAFGANHRNFLLYQPQGKLLLSAGFGNLAGGIDIWDVSSRNKVAEFKAYHSTHCEWSPCGRYILTATLSPRLRVDNGIKIWWCGGQLLHIQPQEELYAASFRPVQTEQVQTFPAIIPSAPEANPSVALYRPKGESDSSVASKPVGAYRPPGARGLAASGDILHREDEPLSSGATTPTPGFKGGKPAGRYVPGGGIPGAPPPMPEKDGKKKKRSRGKGEKDVDVEMVGRELEKFDFDAHTPAVPAAQAAPAPAVNGAGAGGDDAVQKEIRKVQKKLRAIDDLKEKLAKGETVEKNQLAKMETEGALREELRKLEAGAK